MTAACLALSLLAALGFYLACAHQRLWPSSRARSLRAGAWACTVLASAAAIVEYGFWAGVFAALTALMLFLVLLPYLDAWRQTRRGPAP